MVDDNFVCTPDRWHVAGPAADQVEGEAAARRAARGRRVEEAEKAGPTRRVRRRIRRGEDPGAPDEEYARSRGKARRRRYQRHHPQAAARHIERHRRAIEEAPAAAAGFAGPAVVLVEQFVATKADGRLVVATAD